MSIDYRVGYCRPPKETQFKKGVCPNPKGRGKSKEPNIGTSIESILNERVVCREGNLQKRVTARELIIKKLVAGALKGNVNDAEMLLTIHSHALKFTSDEPIEILIKNALPDDM